MKETWNQAEISENIKPVNYVNADSWNAAELNEAINLFGIKYPADTWNPAELDEKARNIINDITSTKTITGNPISFKTINGGLAKSCEVTFSPIQDLHGQSAPYPAGGGANKWNEDWELGYINNANGQNTDSQNHIRSKTFSVCESSTEYRFIKPAGQWFGVFWYASDDSYIDFSVFATDEQKVITSPSNATKFKICTGGSATPVTTYSGGIACNYPSSVTTYSPYENICPISGRDSVDLTRTGKNLFNVEIEQGTLSESAPTGTAYNSMKANNANRCRTVIPFKVIQYPITISVKSGYKFFQVYLDDEDKYLGSFYSWSQTFTLNNSSLPKVGIIIKNDAGTAITPSECADLLQIELGSTATAYEPYQGETHTATFPDTVYGGEYEFVSGKAKSEWGYIASYNGETITEPWISDRDVYVAGTTPSTGAEVCYKLATPQEITLTPETIELLKGNNTLWTDRDNITLKYSKLALPDDSDGLSLNQKVKKAIEIIKGKEIKEETKKSTTKGRRKKS